MAKQTKSKAIVSYDDFEFYVVYERRGGYGQHEKRYLTKKAIEDLKVEHKKGGRPRQTEWYPISSFEADGMASVKYVAILTFDGLKELISNAMLYEFNETMGIICEMGHLSAVSVDSGFKDHSHTMGYDEDELRRRFKSNYSESIFNSQDHSHVSCYVSVHIKPTRIMEAIHSVFKRPYEELTDKQKKQIQPNIDKYNDLCSLLNKYIEKLADDERNIELDKSQFSIDFRQLPINF